MEFDYINLLHLQTVKKKTKFTSRILLLSFQILAFRLQENNHSQTRYSRRLSHFLGNESEHTANIRDD